MRLFILSAASAQKISILGDSYSTFEGCVSNDTNEIWYFKPENPMHHKNNDVTKVEETWWHQLISNTKGFSLEVNNAFSGDASDLGGICVTYSSDSDIMLELGLTGTAEKKIGYANPFYTLTASSAAKTANISWSQFKQPSWYTEDEKKTFFIDGTDAAAELSSLKFKITGESGDRGNFAVTQVGPKGKCK